MKKGFHSIAVATTIATTMLMQIFVPSIALAVDTTEVSETDITVEETASSESEDETSVDVISK